VAAGEIVMIWAVAIMAFAAGCFAHWAVCRFYPRREDEMLKEYLKKEYGGRDKNQSDR
jgi:hypothetical protein